MTTITLTLADPTPGLADAYYAMLADALTMPQVRDEKLRAIERLAALHHDFAAYVAALQAEATGPTQVQTYWLVRDGVDILGECRLRLSLPERELATYGHIGYYVRPAMRSQGAATHMLRLLREKACAAGLAELLLICDAVNIASMRVIERNGGVKVGEGACPCCGEQVWRFAMKT